MAKITYDIFDDKLLSNSSYEYRLHMLISDHAFSYLILDHNHCLAYRSYTLDAHNRELFSIKDEIEMLIIGEKMLQLSFRDVRVYYLTQSFTLVPEELYNAKDPYLYFNAVCHSPATDIIRMECCEPGIINLYLLKVGLLQYLESSFPGVTSENLFSGLIADPSKISSGSDACLFINIHLNQLQVMACENQRIVMVNNYHFLTAGDVAYFTMLAIDQLSLDPETAIVFLSGHINTDAELYNTICRYVRNVRFRDTGFAAFNDDSVFANFPLPTVADIGRHLIPQQTT